MILLTTKAFLFAECYEGWGKDKYGRCKACAPGTYGPGDSMCHDCPEGMFTPKYKYVACGMH